MAGPPAGEENASWPRTDCERPLAATSVTRIGPLPISVLRPPYEVREMLGHKRPQRHETGDDDACMCLKQGPVSQASAVVGPIGVRYSR